jgi:phage baseplate assembly protein W
MDFVGAGIGFPLRTDATGSIALVRGSREIEESIRLILSTAPGERPMRPAFGCGIDAFVFAPADSGTAGLIAEEVRRALDFWEPRIIVNDVNINFSGVNSGELYITVFYTIKETNDRRNLVFPFYVIPDRALLEEGS